MDHGRPKCAVLLITDDVFVSSDVPDAPRNLEVGEITKKSIMLEWMSPRNDGGAPITGYIVERRQGYSSRWLRASRGPVLDCYFRDTNVYEGSDYEYRVSAENEAGQGPPSRSLGPIIAKEAFGQYQYMHFFHCA